MGVMPEKIGRYEIMGELGKGAMGVVYMARDPMIGRTVALKTMRVDVHGEDTEEILGRLRNEARFAGVLNHTNIVTIYDAGEQEGLFYIAMEYVEGRTLQTELGDRKVLPAEEIIKISKQVCAGLDYAHEHGVIHRDIKPANLMLTTDGTVKIMDFGIAKSGGGMTSTGQVVGTPNYMSPEQVKGRRLDGRSDLFSYAVILYEMLTGEKPFTGESITTIIYKIVNEEPIAPAELDKTADPRLSAAVMTALSKLQDERYQTGAELAAALEGKPVGAEAEVAEIAAAAAAGAAASDRVAAPVAAVPAAVAKKRRPVSAVLSAVLALALVALGFSYLRQQQQLKAEEEAAREALAKAAQQPASPAPAPKPAAEPAAPAAAAATAAPPSKAESSKPERGLDVRSNRSRLRQEEAPSLPMGASPPAPPGSATGSLQVTSNPSGAKVEIDGHSDATWVTPFQIAQIGEGTHRLSFSHEGYIAESRGVNVAAGKKKAVSADLAAALGTLKVTSEPAGATVVVDGKDTGQVTPAKVEVPSGTHEVVVRKDGFQEASKKFKVAVGSTYSFAPKLKTESGEQGGLLHKLFGGIPEGKGAVEVKSEPSDATVLVNGAPEKKHRFFLAPGAYQVTLQRDGYKPLVRAIKVEKGKTVEVGGTLEKK